MMHGYVGRGVRGRRPVAERPCRGDSYVIYLATLFRGDFFFIIVKYFLLFWRGESKEEVPQALKKYIIIR